MAVGLHLSVSVQRVEAGVLVPALECHPDYVPAPCKPFSNQRQPKGDPSWTDVYEAEVIHGRGGEEGEST